MVQAFFHDIRRSGIGELAAASLLFALAAAFLPSGTSWGFLLVSFAGVCILGKSLVMRIARHFVSNEGILTTEESDDAADMQSAMEQLYRERQVLADQVDELATVREVSLAVGSILDFNEMIRAILDLVTTHFRIDKAFIYLKTGEENRFQIVGARAHGDNIPLAKVLKKRIVLGEGIVGRAAAEQRELIEYDTLRGVVAAIPLIAKARVVGLLKLSDPDSSSFDAERCRKLHAIAGAIAIALENARLYRMAVTDGLTGLYVHRHFQHRLEEEFQRSHRYATPLALLLIDIDHFKTFNDTHGHQTGDAVLSGVARLLSEEARTTDVVCRYGGEEMVIICPETGWEGALPLAERIRQKIAGQPFRNVSDTEDLRVTVSIGVALHAASMEKRSELIEKTDAALYAAKRNGRNRVETVTEDTTLLVAGGSIVA